MDARIAKEYYNDIDAGDYIVDANTGVRFDNNQIFGYYEIFQNYSTFLRNGGVYYGECTNGKFTFYWWEVGTCIAKNNYKGAQSFYDMSWNTSCWSATLHNNIRDVFGEAGLHSIAPSCFKMIKGWYQP